MFCAKYYPYKSYLKTIDELIINYNPKDKTLKDFLEKYLEKTIIINVEEHFEEIDAKLFSELKNKCNNFKITINYQNKEHIELVQKYKIPFFFENYLTNIDEVVGLLKYRPTDMYICENLGFSIVAISKILHKYNIKVRVFPNICQSHSAETPSLYTFFIRPEDIEIYSKYVDVFELITDENRVDIICKVYQQGKWFGKINEIIPSFHSELDNRQILNAFALSRIKCDKKCFYGGSCKICKRVEEFAEVLDKNNLILRKTKNKISPERKGEE